MNIDDLSQSKYLKTKDIPDPVTVTIESVKLTNLAKEGEPQEVKPVVKFREFDKLMVFNKTNLTRAANAFGTKETDEWTGRKILLYTDDEIQFGPDIVSGLRVRSAARKPQPTLHKPKPREPIPEDDQWSVDDEER